MTDFPADLVAVHSGQHQIQKNQVRAEGFKGPESFFTVIDNLCVVAFLRQIERDQFCNIVVVIDDQNFLFGYHKGLLFTF